MASTECPVYDNLILVLSTDPYNIVRRFFNGKMKDVLNVLGMDHNGDKYQITVWGKRAAYVKEYLE